jgi:hypothetical protein
VLISHLELRHAASGYSAPCGVLEISGSSVNLNKNELDGESSNHYEDRPIPLCTQDTI